MAITPSSPPPRPGLTPSSSPSAPAPVPGNFSEPTPGDRQKRKLLVIGLMVMAFLLLVGLIPALVLISAPKKPKNTPTPNITNLAAPPGDPKAFQSLSNRIFVKQSDGTNSAYDVGLSAPAGWQARFSNQTAVSYPWGHAVLLNALLSNYSPLSTISPDADSSNYLALMNINGWLSATQVAPAMAPATEQAWYQAVGGITAANVNSVSAQLIDPPVTSEAGGRQGLTAVVSADGNLHGLVYTTMFSSSLYQPTMVVMMAGKIGDQPVVVYGQQGVRDQTWSRLSGLQAASDPTYDSQRVQALAAFKAGTLGSDTVAIQAELVKTLDSLKITVAQ